MLRVDEKEEIKVPIRLFHFILPDVLIWCFSISFDGAAFLLVFSPAGTLASSVTVVSEFALAAPLELFLSAEAAVTNTFCETADKKNIKQSINDTI